MGSNNKIFRYWAVVASGFKEVALEEMAQTLPGLRIDRREKGLSQVIFFLPMNEVPCGCYTCDPFKRSTH